MALHTRLTEMLRIESEPPGADARYSRPPRWPKETMNANRLVPRNPIPDDPNQTASFTDTQP